MSDRYARYGYRPDDALLFFVLDQDEDTGTVHLRNLAPPHEVAQLDFLLGRQRSVCGETGHVLSGGISRFADDRLCRRCMTALRDQTLRVFER